MRPVPEMEPTGERQVGTRSLILHEAMSTRHFNGAVEQSDKQIWNSQKWSQLTSPAS